MRSFYTSMLHCAVWDNGAVGYYADGRSREKLGPFAKVLSCHVVVDGKAVGRKTVYATAVPHSDGSVPARCRLSNEKHVGGKIVLTPTGPEFHPREEFKNRLLDDVS